MRARTTTQRNMIAAARPNHYLKVEVENADRTFKDLTNLQGVDWVEGAQWGESIDQPTGTATISFRRDTTSPINMSLAPTIGASLLNRNNAGAYAPLLDPGRNVKISTAVTDPGVAPVSGDWKVMFIGRIDSVRWSADPVEVQCRDLGGWIIDASIQEKRAYATTTPTAVETVMGQILADWPVFGTPTLYTPVSPGWMINNTKKAVQERKPVLEALQQDWALKIGWVCRYRFDASDNYRLTFYEPNRAKTVADDSFGPNEYRDITSLEVSDADVRNKIIGTYFDSDGALHTRTAENLTSQGKYGVKWMAMELGAGDPIDSDAEMDDLLAAAASDLGSPFASQELETLYYWPVQLEDLYQFLANGTHYDDPQKLAVVGYQHRFANGEGWTTLQCSGNVKGSFHAWFRRGGPEAATLPLAIRIVRSSASESGVVVRVYVADPQPEPNSPILISVDDDGVTSVTPTTDTLAYPTDAVTRDLATTAYREFAILRAPGEAQGRVTFRAERDNRLPAVQSIDLSPQDASGLAMRLHRQSADDSVMNFEVYVANAIPSDDAAIVVRANGQGVTAVIAEDGSQSAILGSRGNLLQQNRDLSQAPWSGPAVSTFQSTGGPDGKGYSEVAAAAPLDYRTQKIADGEFLGSTISGALWLRAATPITVRLAFLNQAAAVVLVDDWVLTPEWKRYAISGAAAISTSELWASVYPTAAGTFDAWGGIGIRGTLSPATDDLDTTDFVRFTVTRPLRQVTATNLVLESDTLATAPWELGGGPTSATDAAATFNGVSFSLIENASAGVWDQPLHIEVDGVHCLGCLLHAFPGEDGSIKLGIYDNDLAAGVTLASVDVSPDGTMLPGTIYSGVGEILSLRALGEGVYELWLRVAELDASHLFFFYAAAAGTCDKYYMSRCMLIAGSRPFPAGIATTTKRVTSTADNPSGLVSFTATRNGFAPTSQSVSVEPSGALGAPGALITVEAEGTARDGNGQGRVRLLVNFDAKTNEIVVYASESAAAAGATPGTTQEDLAATITRQEGVIAGDDNFKAEFDIPTTDGWYRQIAALIYGGRTDTRTSRFPPVQSFEVQAVDTGTAPSGPPDNVVVTFSTVNGVPRALVEFDIADALASHRVFRNKTFLIRLEPGNASFVDDGLTPGKAYSYQVQAVRNGQTSEFAGGPGDTGTGGTSDTPTLAAPTWAFGYPVGGGALIGDGPAYVNVRVVNPDPLASTQVWASPGATDTGPFTQVTEVSTDATLFAAELGAVSGDTRWFYLVSTRPGYTDSAPSAHASATFRPDA